MATSHPPLNADPHRALRIDAERPARAELFDALQLAVAAAVALLASAAFFPSP